MSPYRDDLEALEIRRAALAREVETKRRELAEAARLVDESKALARLPVLDGIRVAAPCTQAWTAMTGDDRVRHCAACDQRVYDLSELTRAEAQALVIEKEGRLCVRFYQRADGTILLKDCSIGVHRRRRQRLVVAGAAAGVVALLAGGAAGYLAIDAPADDGVRLEPAEAIPADDRVRAVELERMRAHAAQVTAERAMRGATTGMAVGLTLDEIDASNRNLAVAVAEAKEARARAQADRDATFARTEAALAAAQAATASAEAAQRAQVEAEAELEAARARTRALEQRLHPADKLEP